MQRKGDIPGHFVSESCHGEDCGMCWREHRSVRATHKVGEEILHDDSAPIRHNYTQYVCCMHFAMIFGEWTHDPDKRSVARAMETGNSAL